MISPFVALSVYLPYPGTVTLIFAQVVVCLPAAFYGPIRWCRACRYSYTIRRRVWFSDERYNRDDRADNKFSYYKNLPRQF